MLNPEPDPDDLTPSAELFAQYLDRREQGRPTDFDAFCAAHPAHEGELRRLERNWHLVDSTLIRDGSPTPPIDRRYELDGEIARGGMGIVVRAFDRTLQRKVAIKFGTASAADPRAASRFFDEARITGQLDHPGIVPIYDLGTDAEQRPYFTMPLLRGRTFREVIEAVHAGDPEWTLPRALGVLLAVCDAVASAHAKGVIHRDLKPGNVIVGRFGETYVMDWGLAHVLSEKDRKDIRLRDVIAASSVVRAARRDLADDDPESPLITMDGDVVGTPAYMPPEQARGEVERVGPRADVYAAGAMLYHVIAGEMPYSPKGARVSARTVLARVLDGPPKALPELAPRVPAELIAICAKAMAREPEDRYPDMRALAADLRAFLELRVVRAYGGGAWRELRKWVQRNRVAAGACAAGVLALGTGLFLSLRWKQQAAAQAARAEAGYDGALDAVDRMVVRVGVTTLAHVPGAETVRRELLQDARALYEKFLAEHGDRPELRARVARTHQGLASLHEALGEYEAAEQQQLAAVAAFEQQLAEHPDDVEALWRRAATLRGIGALHHVRGRGAEAEAAFLRAGQAVTAARARHPQHAGLREVEIEVQNGLGVIAYRAGRIDEGAGHLREAVRLAEANVEVAAGALEARLRLAKHCHTLGAALAEAKRVDEGEEPLQRAITCFEALLAESPRDPEVRSGAARVWMAMEVVHRARKQNDEGLRALGRAIELFRELGAEFPRVTEYHHMTASALSNRGMLLNNLGRASEALADLEEAIKLQRIAVAAAPENKGYRRSLGNNLLNRLFSWKELGNHVAIAEHADELAALDPESARQLQFSGAYLLMGATVASQDQNLEPSERERVRDELVTRGVTWLRAAMRKGFHAHERFRGEEFAGVREHPAVRQLLDDMRAAAAATKQ